MKLRTAIAAMIICAAAIVPSHAKTKKSIVEVAEEAGTFKTLLAAAVAADLADDLDKVYGLTVFAPTDDAFAALPEGTVEDLLKPENKNKLRAILQYHIVPGRIRAAQIPRRDKLIETLQGCERIRTKRFRTGRVTVDDAKVEAADISARNGVIHVINKVLMPERLCD